MLVPGRNLVLLQLALVSKDVPVHGVIHAYRAVMVTLNALLEECLTINATVKLAQDVL